MADNQQSDLSPEEADLQAVCDVLSIVAIITDYLRGSKAFVVLDRDVLKPLSDAVRGLRTQFKDRLYADSGPELPDGEAADRACVRDVNEAYRGIWKDAPDGWEMFTRQDWLWFQFQVHRLAGRYADRLAVEGRP
jgi:hypothetical protein